MTCIFEGARVRNGRIPSDSARWLARQVRSMGVPLAAILEGTRLAEDWLDDENALITPEQYLAVVGNSLDATGDPALGLTVGPRQYLGDLGFLGYAIISSPTLLEANQTALKFWELNGSLVTLSCREEGEFLSWEILPAFPIPSAACGSMPSRSFSPPSTRLPASCPTKRFGSPRSGCPTRSRGTDTSTGSFSSAR